MKFKLNLSITDSQANELMLQRANLSRKITPELVTVDKINKPQAYKKYRHMESKDEFRKKLIDSLYDQWNELYDDEIAEKYLDNFLIMADGLHQKGAMIFADLINQDAFKDLVDHYDHLLETHGNKSWIHSYVNLANHLDYLGNSGFNNAFMHPLLIALVSYQIGAPVRLVDARAKNAEPMSIKAQDNMLHIDNTPFNDEYKIIVTWEKGKVSGPKGQNFVVIPGTHHASRNCLVDKDGQAWSTENGSIFITEDSVGNVFDIQRQVTDTLNPQVVEVTHPDKPLTTVFAAGSLVHHRYRTEAGYSRSCMILALHSAYDNPGQFVDAQYLDVFDQTDTLNRHLFGNTHSEEIFLTSLKSNATIIAQKVDDLQSDEVSCEIIEQSNRQLDYQELEDWKYAVTKAPTVEDVKRQQGYLNLGDDLDKIEFQQQLKKMMMIDKHGPLDLILYEDAHEEIRKWARNRIREMKVERLNETVELWSDRLSQPSVDDLLSSSQIEKMISDLTDFIDYVQINQLHEVQLPEIETISKVDALRSIKQLIEDLGEAIQRCDTSQTFLSTSLFLFLAVNELASTVGMNQQLNAIGSQLLSNYITTAIAVEKQHVHTHEQEMQLPKLLAQPDSLFLHMQEQALVANRHNSPHDQRAYDQRYGLVAI
ncbi:MAG: hypothetical protein EP298_05810 [Gammaproteobacteria bacterium]|nr:MAG: hypothetical protein EP298_05810 [Gammaproteobacteria bacterium]UTW41429.1 hypothetical protein KFE69_07860 [bacterium SCSIO 12844]